MKAEIATVASVVATEIPNIDAHAPIALQAGLYIVIRLFEYFERRRRRRRLERQNAENQFVITKGGQNESSNSTVVSDQN